MLSLLPCGVKALSHGVQLAFSSMGLRGGFSEGETV